MPKKLVKRWQTRRGKYWLELYEDETGFSYRVENGGGHCGDLNRTEAICLMVRKMRLSQDIDNIRYQEVPIDARAGETATSG
jgi:hypothetical protein